MSLRLHKLRAQSLLNQASYALEQQQAQIALLLVQESKLGWWAFNESDAQPCQEMNKDAAEIEQVCIDVVVTQATETDVCEWQRRSGLSVDRLNK